jgi:ABC-type glycerol-3-phosphate transport system substrate-binding protein
MVVDAADLQTLASSDLVRPLDALLPPDKMTDRFPFAVELGAVEGPTPDQVTTMGFVIGTDMQHLVYRLTLLASPPLTWRQVISPPVSFLFPAGGQDQQVNDATLIQYLAAGGQLTTPEGNPLLNKGVMAGVLTFYSDCVGTGAISPTVVLNITGADQSWELFKAGENDTAVVQASRYWLERGIPAEVVSAAAAIPTYDGRPFGIAQGGWVITLTADDPVRQGLAMQLLNWLTDPERSAQWTRAAGYLPGTRSALRLWDNISDGERAALRGMMEADVLPPPPKVMTTIGPVMQEAVEAVLKGQATPNGAATTAAQKLGQ